MRTGPALILFLALLPAGCLYVGGKGRLGPVLSPQAVASIRPGRTTKAEVLALLGPPNEYKHPELEAVLVDDELRVAGALAAARRAERVFTWQADRVRFAGTWLLLYNLTSVETDSDLLVVFFDVDDVVADLALRRVGDGP